MKIQVHDFIYGETDVEKIMANGKVRNPTAMITTTSFWLRKKVTTPYKCVGMGMVGMRWENQLTGEIETNRKIIDALDYAGAEAQIEWGNKTQRIVAKMRAEIERDRINGDPNEYHQG